MKKTKCALRSKNCKGKLKEHKTLKGTFLCSHHKETAKTLETIIRSSVKTGIHIGRKLERITIKTELEKLLK